MKKETIQCEPKAFDCELGGILVGYTKNITKYPLREENFHGQHFFNEDEVDIELTSVELSIETKATRGIEILHLLNNFEKQAIIDKLDY